NTCGEEAGIFAPDSVFRPASKPHIACVSEIAPTTLSEVSLSPRLTASDTIELMPPRDGMNTRKKIALRALRISENRRSMSGGGGGGFFTVLAGGCALPGMLGENQHSKVP